MATITFAGCGNNDAYGSSYNDNLSANTSNVIISTISQIKTPASANMLAVASNTSNNSTASHIRQLI